MIKKFDLFSMSQRHIKVILFFLIIFALQAVLLLVLLLTPARAFSQSIDANNAASCPCGSYKDTVKLFIPVPGITDGCGYICDVTGEGTANIVDYIIAAYRFLVGLAAVVAVVMIMVNGYRWIFAAGNSSQIEDAKGGITSAVVGLTLALVSVQLLNFINPRLTDFDPNFDPESVRRVESQLCTANDLVFLDADKAGALYTEYTTAVKENRQMDQSLVQESLAYSLDWGNSQISELECSSAKPEFKAAIIVSETEDNASPPKKTLLVDCFMGLCDAKYAGEEYSNTWKDRISTLVSVKGYNTQTPYPEGQITVEPSSSNSVSTVGGGCFGSYCSDPATLCMADPGNGQVSCMSPKMYCESQKSDMCAVANDYIQSLYANNPEVLGGYQCGKKERGLAPDYCVWGLSLFCPPFYEQKACSACADPDKEPDKACIEPGAVVAASGADEICCVTQKADNTLHAYYEDNSVPFIKDDKYAIVKEIINKDGTYMYGNDIYKEYTESKYYCDRNQDQCSSDNKVASKYSSCMQEKIPEDLAKRFPPQNQGVRALCWNNTNVPVEACYVGYVEINDTKGLWEEGKTFKTLADCDQYLKNYPQSCSFVQKKCKLQLLPHGICENMKDLGGDSLDPMFMGGRSKSDLFQGATPECLKSSSSSSGGTSVAYSQEIESVVTATNLSQLLQSQVITLNDTYSPIATANAATGIDACRLVQAIIDQESSGKSTACAARKDDTAANYIGVACGLMQVYVDFSNNPEPVNSTTKDAVCNTHCTTPTNYFDPGTIIKNGVDMLIKYVQNPCPSTNPPNTSSCKKAMSDRTFLASRYKYALVAYNGGQGANELSGYNKGSLTKCPPTDTGVGACCATQNEYCSSNIVKNDSRGRCFINFTDATTYPTKTECPQDRGGLQQSYDYVSKVEQKYRDLRNKGIGASCP